MARPRRSPSVALGRRVAAMPTFPWRWSWGVTALVALGVATLSLTVANWDTIRPNHFPTQDDRAVMALIRDATQLEFSLAGPPQARCGPLPVAVSREMSDRADRLLPHYFSGEALQSQLAQASAALLGSERGCSQAGGVRRVDIDRIAVAGGHADAQARIEAWDLVGQPQADGGVAWARPDSLLDYQFTVQHVAAGWRITAYRWVFAPGSGP